MAATVALATVAMMSLGTARASAAPPAEPSPGVLSAPSRVNLGEQYTYTGTACGAGWTITKVDWYIWGPMSHQPVMPQYGAVLDHIVQTDAGVVVTVVAGQSGRSDPLWYTTQPVETYFFERLGLTCEKDGVVVLVGSNSVQVVPPSGASWGVWPEGAYDAVTGLNVIVSSTSCTVGTSATLQLVAVPGTAGRIAATVIDGPETGWASATFLVDFRRGGAWNVVDYVFTCSTASGTLTSTFHHPDWGFILASGGTLPSSGSAPTSLVALALALVALGETLRRLARRSRDPADPQTGWQVGQ